VLENILNTKNLNAAKADSATEACLKQEAMERILREIVKVLRFKFHPAMLKKGRRPAVETGGSNEQDTARS
jgi:hypothetical protein